MSKNNPVWSIPIKTPILSEILQAVNKVYKKLTDKEVSELEKEIKSVTETNCSSNIYDLAKMLECRFDANCKDKLSEYENLERQGKLLRLHFSVGDTVYVLVKNRRGETVISETKADAFMCALDAVENRFNKTIFTSRKEAMNALRECCDIGEGIKEKRKEKER